jgi:inner membrane protein
MVGDRGVVSVPIVNGRGKVRLGDSVWIAEGPELGVGTPVVVTGVRGTCVIVDAAG